jgi:hypothetical protein
MRVMADVEGARPVLIDAVREIMDRSNIRFYYFPVTRSHGDKVVKTGKSGVIKIGDPKASVSQATHRTVKRKRANDSA